ncbi:MAG: DUF2148 domain-containing protein [Bacteroidales bacterium]
MITDKQILQQNLREVAGKMIMAARTAPKAKGKDHLYCAILQQEDIQALADLMIQTGEEKELTFFERDGHNLKETQVLVMLGSSISPLNIPECGFCGFSGCDEKRKHPGIPCAFNSGDLGIAIGSAVSVATDCRVDNRIMFTAGKTAIKAGMLPENIKIAYGIPLSATAKNPFFDRK